jgi:hypothetical protein
MTSETKNKIGNAVQVVVRGSLIGWGVWATYNGRNLCGFLSILLGVTIQVWKNDGEWFDGGRS